MDEVKRRITNKQAPPQTIRNVFEELNRPGVDRLKLALRSRSIPFTDEEVRNVVRGNEQRQLFAPRRRYEGKVVSSRPNERWAADLIHMTAQPSPPYTHILVVQDTFTRKIFARALQSATPQEVTVAFRDILSIHPTPQSLTTDKGI